MNKKQEVFKLKSEINGKDGITYELWHLIGDNHEKFLGGVEYFLRKSEKIWYAVHPDWAQFYRLRTKREYGILERKRNNTRAN